MLKQIYEDLLKSGELLIMFPTLKGNWKEDKKEFEALQALDGGFPEGDYFEI